MIELSKDMDPVILLDYLLDRQIVEKQPTTCEIEVPGEGNMNVVLRLRYDDRSVIIKQSKPFVRKYPAIAAPLERLLTEARYYQYCQDVESIRTMSPGLLHIDPDNFILVLEDLGEGSDLTSAYQLSSQLTQSDVEHLINYISALHSLEWSESQIAEFPENLKLRKLNHQHIFVLPYRSDNGFDLDSVQPGLAKVASQYIDKEAVMRKATELGELYLGPGKILLHGDYYPGSWL
ncbi:MAG: hypothetical protein OEQ53_13515, partial [Saprospiraceae bacterium]|nr:hypothetical protein [Saprospiraceae bacterium]